jgi:hypothetical protein
MKKIIKLFLLVTILSCVVSAQTDPFHQWTLLDKKLMAEIAGEASGDIALHNDIAMAGWERNRHADEFASTFWEADYVLKMLKEYGFTNAKIDRFPSQRKAWDGLKGKLWEVSPKRQKLADYEEIGAMLASGSKNANVTAELVWVGEGKEKDFEGKDVTGKIAVSSASISTLHSIAVKKGAVGVISFYSPRPLVDPLQIPWSGIQGYGRPGQQPSETKFGFFLPPREGYALRDRLLRGEKITVNAVVESQMVDYTEQVPNCVIEGTDPNAEEIILSAHLFEGYDKIGANDDISGCAAILDVARTLKTLFDEGRLPKPKRSIRFIFAPEFSGTIPWVKANKPIMDRTLCNINLDMVGLWLSKSGSFLCLERTTYGNPHYINDVMENYYRYMGETNRELIQGRMDNDNNWIVSSNGSNDPFYYQIETHYGASDHEVFNDWGVQVPGIMMITWPDNYYHTSHDNPDKLDATQLKRVVAIAAAAAYTIASADDDMMMKIASEVAANGIKRIGYQLSRGYDLINNSTAENFMANAKKAVMYIDACSINEKATLASVEELAADKKKADAYFKSLSKSLEKVKEADLLLLDQQTKILAAKFGIKKVEFPLSDIEKKAKSIVPKPTALVKEGGYGGYQSALPKQNGMFPGGPGRRDPNAKEVADRSEMQRLCDGKNSLLDIKKLLDTQNQRESDLQAIIDYAEVLKTAKLVEY